MTEAEAMLRNLLGEEVMEGMQAMIGLARQLADGMFFCTVAVHERLWDDEVDEMHDKVMNEVLEWLLTNTPKCVTDSDMLHRLVLFTRDETERTLGVK